MNFAHDYFVREPGLAQLCYPLLTNFCLHTYSNICQYFQSHNTGVGHRISVSCHRDCTQRGCRELAPHNYRQCRLRDKPRCWQHFQHCIPGSGQHRAPRQPSLCPELQEKGKFDRISDKWGLTIFVGDDSFLQWTTLTLSCAQKCHVMSLNRRESIYLHQKPFLGMLYTGFQCW